ncbi:MAG: hypothetical protein WBK26_11190 [Burkholderiaceae bacterium]
MIAAILSILGSSAVGSLIGGVFAFLNRKADIEAKRLDNDHALALRRADLELAQAEAQGKLQVAVVEAEGSIETARMVAIGQAHQADALDAAQIKAAGKVGGLLLVLTDVLRRLIRPAATVALVGAALALNWLLIDRLAQTWPSLTPAQQLDAAMQAFAWITGQASMVLGYWFISRGGATR